MSRPGKGARSGVGKILAWKKKKRWGGGGGTCKMFATILFCKRLCSRLQVTYKRGRTRYFFFESPDLMGRGEVAVGGWVLHQKKKKKKTPTKTKKKRKKKKNPEALRKVLKRK